jgi:hypothetical protein
MAARPAYQHELGDDFRDAVWSSGRFSALQMFRVAAWKSARGLASLTLNTEDEIARHTSEAMKAVAPWRKSDVLKDGVDWQRWRDDAATAIGSKRAGTGLLGLEGFGYPMASAFLAVLAPGAFPVIDVWTVRAVYGADVSKTQSWHRFVVYVHFTQELVRRQEDYADAPTVHRIDQAVMSRAMNCQHSVRPCACYPYWPVAKPSD